MATPPRVVVASDAFKGSLSSVEVGEAVRLGVLDAVPEAVVDVVGVADGGEGTVAAALAAGWRAVPATVSGPTGEPVTATLAVSRDPHPRLRVLVELADACGLLRLPGGVPAPLAATSRGLGEALRAALDLEPDEVVVGIGGSASTDGGSGLLAALGARVLGADGFPVAEGGAALATATSLDLSDLDPRLSRTRLVVAADVDSPLLGPDGAAAVFGPQKGASPAEVAVLEGALSHWSHLAVAAAATPAPWAHEVARPGAGAAGGVGFALLTLLGAERRSGVETVLDLVGLDGDDGDGDDAPGGLLAGADLVVTGEGSLDRQTLAGKAVAGVAARARAAGVPAVAVCGRLDLGEDDLRALGLDGALSLADLEPDPGTSVREAAALLRRVGADLARSRLRP